MGVVIYVRRLSAIMVTLGASFVWLGIALLILPNPGGLAPAWLTGLARLPSPLMPLPLWLAVVIAILGHYAMMRSAFGVILRGAGGNAKAISRAGWSLLKARFIIYFSAGILAVLSGMSLIAITTSGDPNVAPTYTLVSIAAVILGGGTFVGGIMSPAGAVAGAMTLSLAGSMLSFLNVPPVWQIGVQGCILVAVLGGRALVQVDAQMSTLRLTLGRSASGLMRSPWLLNFAAAFLIWGLTMIASGGRGGAETLTVAFAFSVFTVLAGTGQMFVIAAGPGNIDLSIPAVMTLAAYLSMGAMGGSAALLPVGLAIAIGVGMLAGVGNIILIRTLRIPPIIATLALSFMLTSLANNAGGEATIKPPMLLADFTIWRIGGVQVLLVLTLLLSALVQVTIGRSVFGRQLLAVGQNDRAAALTGINVWLVRLGCYCLSGAFAGLTGFLLSGFSGGAMLNMGGSYLMESVAVVVLGGTSIAGGRANAIGIWGAALFFNLLATMINAYHLEEGWRFISTGAIILLVIAFNSEEAN